MLESKVGLHEFIDDKLPLGNARGSSASVANSGLTGESRSNEVLATLRHFLDSINDKTVAGETTEA